MSLSCSVYDIFNVEQRRARETIRHSMSLKTASFNPLIATVKPQSNGASYSNTVIGTLAVDGWAVTFGIQR